ncbi:MAG: hypothetical protein C3F07_05970 [Anaerolineales bacterium]|nr:MAG: hypothetical protein C3F07_05970 [Anaerolineales bacterium]
MFKKILVIMLVMSLILPVGVVMAGNGPGGPGGGGGGGGDIPDTGELYGDLYVILRDMNGVPILDANGCIQPISSMDGSTTLPDGTEVIAYAYEPFTLGTYYDSEGVLIECELTEDMTAWVQAVDFGRLNLGRAPEGVIAHAFDEAINKMNSASAFDLDPAGRIMMLLDDGWFTIDAPAENLALYIKMMIDGHWITVDTTPVEPGGKGGGKGGGGGPPEGDGPSTEPRPVLSDTAIGLLAAIGYDNLGDVNNVLNSHDLLLAASLLAGAADKSGTITLDKVVYINSIYGINQVGTIVADGNRYFDFSGFGYSRRLAYIDRGSPECATFGSAYVWVLQPFGALEDYTFKATCMSLLGYNDPGFPADYNAVRFVDLTESYTTVFDELGNPLSYNFYENVRAFTQASDDALQAIEYIHNYKIPEVLYP